MRLIMVLCTLLAAAPPVGAAAQESGRTGDPSPSPLYEASRAGDIAAIQRLLRAGADPDAGVILDEATGNRDTPLGIALKMRPEGLSDVVRLLLEAGADPNLVFGRVGDEVAPLHVATMDSPDEVRLLLEAGADPDVGICGGVYGEVSTPLGTAEYVGDSVIAELLRGAGAADPTMSGAELAVARNAADAPLHAAIWRRDLAAVDRLLRAGSDPNSAIGGRRLVDGDVERFTPLGLAIRVESESEVSADLVSVLLAAGADPNERLPSLCRVESLTPLLIASGRGEVEVVDLLLSAGADPNASVEIEDFEDSDVWRLLSSAPSQGGTFTPLRLALEAGHAEVEVVLRRAGGIAPAGTETRAGDLAMLRDFEQRLAACTPGAFFTSSVAELGASVRYEIIGPERSGCRVSMTFDSNPNPDWVNKPLMVTLDVSDRVMHHLQIAMMHCMLEPRTPAAAPALDFVHDCAGPLLEVLRQ